MVVDEAWTDVTADTSVSGTTGPSSLRDSQEVQQSPVANKPITANMRIMRPASIGHPLLHATAPTDAVPYDEKT